MADLDASLAAAADLVATAVETGILPAGEEVSVAAEDWEDVPRTGFGAISLISRAHAELGEAEQAYTAYELAVSTIDPDLSDVDTASAELARYRARLYAATQILTHVEGWL
jgi:hypothetical protein